MIEHYLKDVLYAPHAETRRLLIEAGHLLYEQMSDQPNEGIGVIDLIRDDDGFVARAAHLVGCGMNQWICHRGHDIWESE